MKELILPGKTVSHFVEKEKGQSKSKPNHAQLKLLN